MRDCTEQAKQVWAIIHPDRQWPKGWRVIFRKLNGTNGRCNWVRKIITLANKDTKINVIDTLIHEFVHMHYRHHLKHGREFRQVQGRWMTAFYGEARRVNHLGEWYSPETGKRLPLG